MKFNYKGYLDKPYISILFLACGYLLVAFYLVGIEKFNFFQGDVQSYSKNSLNWNKPFDEFHVPGYPLTIALFRAITFGQLPTLWLMVTINFVTFLLSVFIIYRITQKETNVLIANIVSTLFGLWPFVGLTNTVMPIADLPSLFLFLSGFLALKQSKSFLAAALLGLALVTHKAMWPFVILLIIADMVNKNIYFTKRNILFIGILFLPLGIIFALGSIHHQSIFWLVSTNISVEMASSSSLPVMDGLLGTYTSGGLKGVLKGLILTCIFLLTVITLYSSTKVKSEYRIFNISTSLTILIFFIILNQHEIWAAIRFSRVLAVPIGLCYFSQIKLNSNIVLYKFIYIIILLLLITQFIWSWYMSNIFYSNI